jgi:hypothetical protein
VQEKTDKTGQKSVAGSAPLTQEEERHTNRQANDKSKH